MASYLQPFAKECTHYVRSIDLQALPVEGRVLVHRRRLGDLRVADAPPSREPLAPGRRDSQHARGDGALGGGGAPLPTQDAAAAFLRVCVEGHLAPGFRAAPNAFWPAGAGDNR